jgi:autotransporter-associated beta strand protein
MKTRFPILKFIVLFNLFATTAMFGATIVWDGGDGTGTALGGTAFGPSTNWVGDVSPNSANGDVCQWDGTVPGNLFLTAGFANGNFNNGTPGVSFYIAAGHTGSLNIRSIFTSSANIALNTVGIDSGAGAFSLGDGTANVLNFILRPSSSGAPYPIHDWVNNSTNAAVIYPNVRWTPGGGNPHQLLFDGTGDWIVTNGLSFAAVPYAMFIGKAGSGTLFWSGPSIAGAAGAAGAFGNPAIPSPLDFEGGAVVLLASGLLSSQIISNNGVMFEYAAPAAQTLSGSINGTGLLKVSNGTLTLSGANTYTGNTIISGGTLQVGAGGTSGSVGSGNLTNNGVLVFNRSDNVTFTNVIRSAGSMVQQGSGILTLTAANTFTGTTTVSNGTLVVSSVGGGMNVNGGTLVPVVVGSIGTLSVAGSMNLSSGTVLITLNKSLSPSNSLVSVGGTINNSGGTLKLLNYGPAVVVGDKFTLFNHPVGGAAMTIVSPGFSVTNNLAVDGSVTVTDVAPPGTGKITPTLLGGQFNLSWPASFTGLHLQTQTNPLTIGLNTNWVTIPGSDATNSYYTTMNPSASVFYRLAP